MAIPDFQTLMLPVLKLSQEGEIRISDAVDRLADEFQLKAEEREHLLPSGRQTTFANRVHWAKSYLGKAGLVELTRRAYFKISARGLDVLSSPPSRIDIKYLEKFPGFSDFRDNGLAEGALSGAKYNAQVGDSILFTPDEVIRRAHSELEQSLATDLLVRIRMGSPAFFESVTVRLLVAMGYGGASVTDISSALVGGSGDGGIDGVIDQDPLGLDRIYVQAKRYAEGNLIGPSAIRDFFGSLDRFKATKGLFVTTSSFTQQAKDTADLLSKRIVLIDGVQFTRLMIRHGVGCRIQETLSIKAIDEEFFE